MGQLRHSVVQERRLQRGRFQRFDHYDQQHGDDSFQYAEPERLELVQRMRRRGRQRPRRELLDEPVPELAFADGQLHEILAPQRSRLRAADRLWGNEQVPCIHADPRFPDCAPGETVRLRGWLSFYEGDDIRGEFKRLKDY